MVIETDGDYYNDREIEKYDRNRTISLESLRLKVLRFTNREIDTDFLNKVVKARKQTPTLP